VYVLDTGCSFIYRFVDRDMYMRYRGGGVGHIDPTQVLEEDGDTREMDKDELEAISEEHSSDSDRELSTELTEQDIERLVDSAGIGQDMARDSVESDLEEDGLEWEDDSESESEIDVEEGASGESSGQEDEEDVGFDSGALQC